jgi:hypothetical protein
MIITISAFVLVALACVGLSRLIDLYYEGKRPPDADDAEQLKKDLRRINPSWQPDEEQIERIKRDIQRKG